MELLRGRRESLGTRLRMPQSLLMIVILGFPVCCRDGRVRSTQTLVSDAEIKLGSRYTYDYIFSMLPPHSCICNTTLENHKCERFYLMM